MLRKRDYLFEHSEMAIGEFMYGAERWGIYIGLSILGGN